MRSIKRGLDVVLHVLVPVSGANDSRPLVDIVLAYLNDPKGLLGLISEAHMSWQNPAVAAKSSCSPTRIRRVGAGGSGCNSRAAAEAHNQYMCVCYLTLALLA